MLAVGALVSVATLDQLGALSPDGRRGRFDGLEACVVGVVDGRTLLLDIPDPRTGEPLVVRLWGVTPADDDAPTTALARMTLGETVTLRTERSRERDPQGRLLAHVIAGKDTVAATLVGQGLAAADGSIRHRDSERFAALELSARRARRGMWREAGADRARTP